MGRQRQTIPPLDIGTVQAMFSVRQDGALVRRDCRVSALTSEPATFRGPGNRLLVRVYLGGKIRRIAAGRIAWALATGQWPRGVVRARDGDDNNCRFDNLIVVKAGPRPFDYGKGGAASALAERQARNTTLLRTLANNPDATVPQLSRLIGASESCTCVRLAKLERQGLTCSPRCQAHIRWRLSHAGSELAATGGPVLDETDRDLLSVVALSPVKLTALAKRVGSCNLTMRRRVNLLVERGLVVPDARRNYAITDAGLAAIGDNALPRPAPWLNVERIRASSAKDVLKRMEHPNDHRSAEFRSKVASMGAQAGVASQRLRRTGIGQAATGEFDRMAG